MLGSHILGNATRAYQVESSIDTPGIELKLTDRGQLASFLVLMIHLGLWVSNQQRNFESKCLYSLSSSYSCQVEQGPWSSCSS